MDNQEKKSYESPALTMHGDVAEITKEGGTCVNSDTPRGEPGRAFPAGSGGCVGGGSA